MGKKFRKIVCLITKNGTCYVDDHPPFNDIWVDRENFKVESITAYRDGVTGLFKEETDGAHYIVTLVNIMADKVKVHDVIPSREVAQLSYAYEEKSGNDTDQIELTAE